ncbi:MAG: hypothetical protein AAGK97_07265, partial [Bacteroidota bacterium]
MFGVFSLITLVSYAQISVKLSTTESTCENNGTITANSNGVPNFSYTLSGPVDLQQTSADSTTFSSLPPGNYSVTVTDNNGEMATESIEVIGSYVQPGLDLVVENVSCPGASNGILTAIMTNGLPAYEYEILSGPQTVARGSNNIFTDLPVGSYTVRAYDQCNNFQTRTAQIVEEYTPVDLLSVGSTSGRKTDCDASRYEVSGLRGTPDYQYRIIDPADYATDYQSSGEFFTPYDPATRAVTFEVIDACGQTDTRTMNAPRVSLLRSVNGFDCDGFDLRLSPSNMVEPITYEIVNGPNGAETLPGADAGHIPYGSYSIRATDACGIVRTQNFTELLVEPEFDSFTEFASTCYEDAARGIIRLVSSSTSNLAPPITINFLEHPADYAGPNPYTTNSSSTSFYIDPMTAGNYRAEIIDGCGGKDTFELTVTLGLEVEVESVLTPGCIDNNRIDATFITNGNNAFGSPWRLFELGSDDLVDGPNSSGSFVNIPAGDYYVEYRKCNNLNVRDTFTIEPYIQPDMDPIVGIECGDGSITITSTPSGGIEPYMYEIISGPVGQTYPIGPQASPTFDGLVAGTNYRMRIFDACGNSSSGDVSVVPGLDPVINADGNPCLDDPFEFSVALPLIDADYVWTLPDGSQVNGSSLSIPALTAAHEGTYTLDVTLGTCASEQLTYDIDFGLCVLPLEWVTLKAKNEGNYNSIHWITQNEINVSHFELEKSNDGIKWTKIEETNALGFSQE